MKQEIRPGSIREARLNKGFSQKKLAEELSVVLGYEITNKAVSHWEKGRCAPTADHLRALHEVLEVSEGFFLVRGDRPQAEKYVNDQDAEERKRLRNLKFRPGFFEYLESVYECRIETLNAWIRTDPGKYCGRFGVGADYDLSEGLPGNYDIEQSAAAGTRLLDHPRDDHDDGIFPDDFEDSDDDNYREEIKPAAVFHFNGRRKDCAASLDDLLEVQRMLDRFTKACIEEKLDRFTRACGEEKSMG